MPWPDMMNATFEGVGGIVVLLNIQRILKDKIVRGFDWRVAVFFWIWGLWNLYYYSHLEQMLSFYAGISMVTVDAVYLYLLLYYTRMEKGPRRSPSKMKRGACVKEVTILGDDTTRTGRVRRISKMRMYDGGHGKNPDARGYSEYKSVWINWEDGQTEQQPQGKYFYDPDRRCWVHIK
ncbi:MAG: hypothetical protein V3S55_15270 [Nitrospiraceae bacterium]